jgi:tRNA nucleotidyltransferase (CCA-adding enzyme)
LNLPSTPNGGHVLELLMQAYRVGGSVRDQLLGLAVVDRDWVVVGATPQDMIDRGFRPVGKDFPVFLHPQTKEEYALARTERKTGPGYKGFAVHFAPGVTLEEDLARRDLTINAIALAEDGTIIDPFGGRRDLEGKLLRHVSESFAEDPVRILRVARFAARFADFTVAPETMALMRRMTAAGEVDALVAERVWQELARGLQETRPSRMIEVLRDSGALRVLLPELTGEDGPAGDSAALAQSWLEAVDRCAAWRAPLAVSYAVFLAPAWWRGQQADEAVRRVSQRLRAPTECRELAALLARETHAARQSGADGLLQVAVDLPAQDLLRLLERCDAWRRGERVTALIQAAAALAGVDPANDAGASRLRRALESANRVEQAAIARRHRGQPTKIRDAIAAERLKLIAEAT